MPFCTCSSEPVEGPIFSDLPNHGLCSANAGVADACRTVSDVADLGSGPRDDVQRCILRNLRSQASKVVGHTHAGGMEREFRPLDRLFTSTLVLLLPSCADGIIERVLLEGDLHLQFAR